MPDKIKAIETKYDGHRFRSRTEAKWAVFFNKMLLAYQYEVQGYFLSDGTAYLPDFFLPEIETFFEVKGIKPQAHEMEKAAMLHRGSGKDVIIAVGQPKRGEWQLIYFTSEMVRPFFSDSLGINLIKLQWGSTVNGDLSLGRDDFDRVATYWYIGRRVGDVGAKLEEAGYARFEHGEVV